MRGQFHELADLRVTVDRVVFAPQLDAPEDRPYPFAYFITIDNRSDRAVTIKGRKWIVTGAHGRREVLEGDGVVGHMPRLLPGQKFSYDSYHVIDTGSFAEGSFFGLTDDGEPVVTRIPRFEMRPPVS